MSVVVRMESVARFPDGLRRMESGFGKKELVVFCFNNKGEDIAEDNEIFISFPPEFKVEEG